MSDDYLKKMLDDALDKVASRDSAQKAERQQYEADMMSSGAALKERILPRLIEAQKAWEGKLKLEILDNSGKFDFGSQGHRINPSITVSASGKEPAAYSFVIHYPGCVSIQEGVGRNRGGTAYEFKVDKIEDLTDAKIDEILQTIMQYAVGLKSRR